jgi:hypothetical protein
LGHDDGNLRSITGCKPRFAQDLPAQQFCEQALLAKSRRERLTPRSF